MNAIEDYVTPVRLDAKNPEYHAEQPRENGFVAAMNDDETAFPSGGAASPLLQHIPTTADSSPQVPQANIPSFSRTNQTFTPIFQPINYQFISAFQFPSSKGLGQSNTHLLDASLVMDWMQQLHNRISSLEDTLRGYLQEKKLIEQRISLLEDQLEKRNTESPIYKDALQKNKFNMLPDQFTALANQSAFCYLTKLICCLA